MRMFLRMTVKENLVFTGNFIKTAAGCAVLSLLASSCALFDQQKTETPNHSWFKGESYGTAGASDAELATVAYSQGHFEEAENYVIQALTLNPRQPQALMVGALVYEKLGRLNRARQYYEDLIIVGGEETTILGTKDAIPERMSEIARQRLRYLNMKQSEILIENKDGIMTFNISKEAASRQGKSAIEEALFVKEQKLIASNQAASAADIKAAEVLFDDNEKNIISRFLIMKELAEKDLITKDEFLNGRMANIGGLLPLTSMPAASGIDSPVPSPDLIIERINSLKEAVESRAITPQEFSVERDMIVEAVLPPNPRQRMKPKAPAKDILSAAKDLRKIEVIHQLGLITKDEKDKEKAAVEKYLGINRAAPKTAAKPEAKSSTKTSSPVPEALVNKDEKPAENLIPLNKNEKPELLTSTAKAPVQTPAKTTPIVTETIEEVIIPEVTSPF